MTGSDRGAGEEDDDNDDDDKFAGLSEADGEDGDLFTGRFKQSPAKKASARKPKQSGKRKRALARECPHESSDNEEPDHSKEKDPEQEAFSGNGGIKDRAETSKPEDLKSKFEPGLLELLLPGMNSLLGCSCESGVLAPSASFYRPRFQDRFRSLHEPPALRRHHHPPRSRGVVFRCSWRLWFVCLFLGRSC